MLHVDGHIYPAANEPLELNAEFSDGTTLSGESEITAAGKLIKRVWVETNDDSHKPEAVSQVIDAIMNADQIVLGPGSLFTSILPNLMIENVGEALRQTHADIVYICNIMTQKGETENFTEADHVRVLNQHLGMNFINTVWLTLKKFHPNILITRSGMKFRSRLNTTLRDCVPWAAGLFQRIS